MTVQNSDKFLVNRSNVSYQVEAQNLMATIQDDDLMLVNRENVSYKVTGLEVKESLDPGPPALTLTVEIAPLIAETGDTLTASAAAAGGVSPYSYTYQWYRRLGVIVGTTIIAGATESTYTLPSDVEGWVYSCEVTVTDDAGTEVSQFSSETQPITQSASIETPEVLFPPDGAGTGGDVTYTPKTSPITAVTSDSDLWTASDDIEKADYNDIAYGSTRYVAVSPNRIQYSLDGANWNNASLTGSNSTWIRLAFNSDNNKFCAVGYFGSGRIAHSGNSGGQEFFTTTNSDANAGKYYAVSEASSYFVAAGTKDEDGSTYIIRSSDGGSSWQVCQWSADVFTARDMAFADQGPASGKLVMVGQSSFGNFRIAYSVSSGYTWTTVSNVGLDCEYQSIVYGGIPGEEKFVAVSSTGENRIACSSDGVNWQTYKAPEDNYWTNVTYGDGKFVAVANTGQHRVMYSADGVDWTLGDIPGTGWWTLTYSDDDEQFLALARDASPSIATSIGGTGKNEAALTLVDDKTYNADGGADMNQPISETFSAGQTVTGVKDGSDSAGGTVVSVSGNEMVVEPNTAYDWTKFEGIGSGYRSVAYGNGRFIATCYDGSDLTSTDGYNWVELDTGVTVSYSITYQQGRFIIASGASFATSETGDPGTWTTHLFNFSGANINQVLFVMPATGAYRTSGVWLTIGTPNFTTETNIWYNPDLFAGSGWQACTGTTYSTPGGTSVPTMNGFATADGRVACMATSFSVAYTSGMWWSDDGINFTESNKPTNTQINPACIGVGEVNGATQWVILSNSGSVMYSPDGANWTYKQYMFNDSSITYAPYGQVVYQGNKFTAAGMGDYNNNSHTIISSVDGINWIDVSGQSAPTPGDSPSSIAFSPTSAVVGCGNNFETCFLFTSAVYGGTFVFGMEVVNTTQVTQYGPDPETLVFVGEEPEDTPPGSIQTWGNATWQVSTDENFTSETTSSVPITDPNTEQTTPAANFNLENDTTYWVRVKYGSTLPGPAIDSLYSAANRFKTRKGEVTVDDSFATTTYAGAALPLKVTNNIDLTSGRALLWTKNTAGPSGFSHYLYDTENGLTLNSNTADQAGDYASAANTYRLESDGYTIDPTSGNENIYVAGNDFVNYTFKQTAEFFDIVEYDATGTVQNVSHNLGSKPGCMIIKSLDQTMTWAVYHQELGATNVLNLNTSEAYDTLNTVWNDTEPTDAVFTVGTSGYTNTSGKYIAYLFADTPGLIKCGGYEGNGTDNYIDCGFDLQWLLIKNTTNNTVGSSDWNIMDIKRGVGNVIKANLPDTQSGQGLLTFQTGGFLLNNNSTDYNNPGDNYIYIAIAEGGATRFFDTEAFKTMTDREVTGKYGIDPYTANLNPLNIRELTQEPVGVTAGFAEVRNSNKLRPIQELANLLKQLEREENITEVKLEIVKERNRILRQYMVDDMIEEAQALIEQWAAEDAAAATQEVDLEDDES